MGFPIPVTLLSSHVKYSRLPTWIPLNAGWPKYLDPRTGMSYYERGKCDLFLRPADPGDTTSIPT